MKKKEIYDRLILSKGSRVKIPHGHAAVICAIVKIYFRRKKMKHHWETEKVFDICIKSKHLRQTKPIFELDIASADKQGKSVNNILGECK